MRSSAIHSAVRAACVGLLAAAVSTPAPAQSTTTQPASAPAATTEPATTPWGAGIPARLLASTQAAATEPATSPSATSQPSPTTTSGPATGPQGVDTPGLAIRNDDVVVFLGDDLVDTPRPTSTNSFPMLVETFMTARYPDLRARYINVGWSGDTVARALLRLDRDMLSHRPTAVVVCLGLNDPEYLPFAEERLAAYRQDLLNLLAKCREAGARVWLMSPPSVDEEKGRKVRVQRAGRPGMTDLQAVGYNSTLQRYAGAMKEAAEQTDSGFVDWFAESAAARARGRQIDPDFALTTDGLNPTDRTHAMAAAALLEAWGAKPIEVTLELTWASGDVKVASHLAPVNVARAEINAAGQRRIVVRNLPLPWPMAGGQAGFLSSDWEAAAMCRFVLRIPDPPERGVTLRIEWPHGGVAHDQPISADQLRNGFNLAATEALNSAREITELFQLIGTKNYYDYGTWRKLALSPPKEAELVEAHRKLIEAWNSYVAGTEKIIHNQPKVFSLPLVLTEAVPVEKLPTSSPPPPAPAPPATATAATTSAPAVTAPASAPVATQPSPVAGPTSRSE